MYFWILQVQFRSAEVIKNKRNLQTPPCSRVIILLSNSTSASSVFRPSTVALTRDSELRSYTRAMLTPSWQSAEVVWTSLIMGQLVAHLIDFTLLKSNFLLRCKKYSVPAVPYLFYHRIRNRHCAAIWSRIWNISHNRGDVFVHWRVAGERGIVELILRVLRWIIWGECIFVRVLKVWLELVRVERIVWFVRRWGGRGKSSRVLIVQRVAAQVLVSNRKSLMMSLLPSQLSCHKQSTGFQFPSSPPCLRSSID